MQILTPSESTKLRELIRQAENRTTAVIREGFESGASQDGHHDEGYQLSKSQGAVANTRVAQLYAVLSQARIVDPVEQNTDVRLGNVVELLLGGERRRITICGYAGVYQGSDHVSISSPLGRALIGKKQGDEFELTASGRNITGEVLQILPPSAAQD